jgi:hypothetical protein
MATRSKLRSGTTRFVGAIVGLIIYLFAILAVNPGGREPQEQRWNDLALGWGAAVDGSLSVVFTVGQTSVFCAPCQTQGKARAQSSLSVANRL